MSVYLLKKHFDYEKNSGWKYWRQYDTGPRSLRRRRKYAAEQRYMSEDDPEAGSLVEKGHSMDLPQEENTVSVSPEALQEHLTEKFEKVLNNPYMQKIFDAVYRYRLRKNGK